MSTEDQVRELRAKVLAAQTRKLDTYLERCESPIERALLLAMMTYDGLSYMPWPDFLPGWWWKPMEGHLVDGPIVETHALIGAIGAGMAAKIGQHAAVLSGDVYARDVHHLFIQANVALSGRPMRLDFAIVGETFKIAIEADGHDFHERTKQQAARDRSRDRILQQHGWIVIRFTGSEIYRDPGACALAIGEQIAVCNLRLCLAEAIECRKREGIE